MTDATPFHRWVRKQVLGPGMAAMSRLRQGLFRYWIRPVHMRIYSAAIVLGAVAWVVAGYTGIALIWDWAMWSCVALFVFGLLWWLVPRMWRLLEPRATNMAAVLFHAFAGVLAWIPAQHVLARSLELPPQDFTASVTVLALAMLPVVWIFLGTCYLVLFYLFMLLRLMGETVRGRRDQWIEAFGHTVGALSLLVLFGLAWGSADGVVRKMKPVISNLAYATDYHLLPGHKGVDPKRPARIHRGGMVSYAERHGLSVHFDSAHLRGCGEESDASRT